MTSTGTANIEMKAKRLSASATKSRLADCDRLPSLSSINFALQMLLSRDDSSTQDISALVRNDPSLAARILRLTNSAFYGLAESVKTVEEAVFYLGVAQIQRLVLASPIIDQFEGTAEDVGISWREFWKHSVAVAMITQELTEQGAGSDDEAAYLAGLVHDVGKIAIAIVFPDSFSEIQSLQQSSGVGLSELEYDYFEIGHAEIGAFYFESHNMPAQLVETTRYHHEPRKAVQQQRIAAAVFLSDLAARSANIGFGGDGRPIEVSDWKERDEWDLLVPDANPRGIEKAQRKVDKLLINLPSMVKELV